MPPKKIAPTNAAKPSGANAAKPSGAPSTSRRRASSSPVPGSSQTRGRSKSANRAKAGAPSTSKKRSPPPAPGPSSAMARSRSPKKVTLAAPSQNSRGRNQSAAKPGSSKRRSQSPSPGPSHGQRGQKASSSSQAKDRKRHGSSSPSTSKRNKRGGPRVNPAGGDDEKTDAATTRWIDDPAEREARRKEDLAALKHYKDLHYPGKSYRMHVQEDHSGVTDWVQKIKDGSHETTKDWERQRTEMGDKYLEEYVVGTAAYNGIWDESKRDISVWVLIVHTNMACAEWTQYTTAQGKEARKPIQWFRYREQRMSIARQKIMSTFPSKQAFDETYPNVFLPLGRDNEWWGSNAICKKQTYLMARETEINEHNRHDGLPPVALADWTDKPLDMKNFMKFLWRNRQILSPRVTRVVAELLDDQIPDEYNCGANCKCQGGPNPCACIDSPWNFGVECSHKCKCDKKKCSNQVVQHGRQYFVLLFNTEDKGWTTFALEDIPRNAFVSPFTGVVLTSWENAAMSQMYCLDQPVQPIDKEGKAHPCFAVNALNLGNESRFLAHSCEGNLEVRSTYTDRVAWSILQINFHAKLNIWTGDELAFQYHERLITEAKRTGEKFYSNLIHKCLCNSKPCWILPWTKKEIADFNKEEANRATAKRKPDKFKFTNAEKK